MIVITVFPCFSCVLSAFPFSFLLSLPPFLSYARSLSPPLLMGTSLSLSSLPPFPTSFYLFPHHPSPFHTHTLSPRVSLAGCARAASLSSMAGQANRRGGSCGSPTTQKTVSDTEREEQSVCVCVRYTHTYIYICTQKAKRVRTKEKRRSLLITRATIPVFTRNGDGEKDSALRERT